MKSPIFETDRFLLRAIEMEDAPIVYLYRSDLDTNKYQGTLPANISEMEEMIAKSAGKMNVIGTWQQYVIIQRDEIVGDFGMHFIDDNKVELGITIDKRYHFKGIAFEALNCAISYLRGELNKSEFMASVDPRNIGSIKLFKKLGFERFSYTKNAFELRGEWVDDLVMRLVNYC